MVSGVGLHSGIPCRVRLFSEAGPVRFRRGREEILARVENVVATERCTTLGKNGIRVALVEHLLAALYIRGWWRGLVVETSADELPILDGSAAPWLEEIDALGSPPPPPEALRLEHPLTYRQNGTSLTARPGAAELSVRVDYPHPTIGQQRWCGSPERYAELLDARTFGFLHEVETLRAAGLATAATLENVIVFGSEGPLRPLRHPYEPVRHKALDALGDLFLFGRPLGARLEVVRGSHQAHVAFLRELCAALGRP